MNILDLFPIIAESGLLFTCMSLQTVFKNFPGVSERLFSVATLSNIFKKCPNSFPVHSFSCS